MINHVFYLTRTFAYYMHRAKMISLGRWPGDPGRKPKLISKNKTLPPAHLTICVSNPINNCSVTGSALPMECHPATPTTPLTTAMQHQAHQTKCSYLNEDRQQYHHTMPSCTTAMCLQPPTPALAHSDHADMGAAGPSAIESELSHNPEQLNAATLVPYQPDVRHQHGQVCSTESDMRDVVLSCASSQHLTIP